MNGQFHLNTSVAPPWGSEVRLNAPPGGLDNPFLGSPGGQTNIFPVTFDQNAPFSLNGPFLSLSNDMASTNVHTLNVTVERQVAAMGRVGRLRRQPHEQHLGVHAAQQRAVRPGQRRGAQHRQHERAPPVDARRSGQRAGSTGRWICTSSDGKQRYKGMLLSVRGAAAYGSTVNANYTLSNCYGSPEGGGGGTTNVSAGYNIPSDPGFDDGNCTSDRLHNFSLIGRDQSPRFDNAGLRAVVLGLAAGGKLQGADGSLADHLHRHRSSR